MKKIITPSILLALVVLFACQKQEDVKPNVVLIMADDMGYECVSGYGSLSCKTPILDSLASQGIRFSHCISQPLCTPSRAKIMTGLYNYRNYEYFGYLNESQYTFGQLMKDAGYQTCIVGKWQLNGLAYPEEITSTQDQSRPNQMGFDEFCLWQLTVHGNKGLRYANPTIDVNGKIDTLSRDDYGPDVFCEYIVDFIGRMHDRPFFIYYPMVLVHSPFEPTPDSEEWVDPKTRMRRDTARFKDMVAYADAIVGRIANTLAKWDLDRQTLLIFTGDNGTHTAISTLTDHGIIKGGKGNTTDAGTRVPLSVYWPDQVQEARVFDGLIEFSDFFATFNDLTGQHAVSDGVSFYPLLIGRKWKQRETVFVHYDPKWSNNVNRHRNRFVRTKDYKLYQDESFFNITLDPLEKNPLSVKNLSGEEILVFEKLQNELDQAPPWN